MEIKKERKTIIYVDMDHIEFGGNLTKLEERTREKLLTTRSLDACIFWLDIKEGLKTLTRMQRKCFVASLIEGYTECEISERLRISQPAVFEHIEMAKEKMKRFLSDNYYDPGNNRAGTV